MGLTWNGDQLLAKIRAAEKAGLQAHADAVVKGAQDRALVESGTWRDSIRVITPPTETGHGVMCEVGSDTIDYAAIQELGPADGRPYRYKPSIRPSADEQAPELSGQVAKELK